MDNTILLKSKKFAVRIIKCYKYLNDQKHEHILSKQLIRCGTSIGANTIESRNAQSRSDFTSKLNIALKEADETAYWLDLLHSSDYLDDNLFNSLNNDCQELISILISIIKSLKNSKTEN